jgi:outer membrane protein
MNKYILTLMVLFVASSLMAAPLSLNDCLKIALDNQADVLTAINSVTISKSQAARAISGYFPQVSVKSNLFTENSGGVLSNVNTGTALTVNQNFFDSGLREMNVKAANYGVEQSKASLNRTLQTVIFNVTQSYYEALRAKHLNQVAEANVKYNEGLRNEVKTRAELGDAAKVDVLPFEAQLANARVSYLRAQNSVRIALINLQSSLGLSTQSGFDIQEITELPSAKMASLDSYFDVALKTRPDIMQAKARLGATRANVTTAEIEMFPRLEIYGNYQRVINGELDFDSSQIVGIIVFDIFNGGANQANLRQAKALRSNADIQEKQLYKDIRAQVEEAYLNFTSAKERMVASAIGLDAANLNYEAQKARYSQGIGITLDLLNAEVQVIIAQSNDVQARYDYYIAVAQLDYAVGKSGETNEK